MKQGNVLNGLCIFCCILLISGCGEKKKEPTPTAVALSAVVTFSVGDVKLAASDGKDKSVKSGDKIAEKDLLKTGAASFAAIQIGDEAVIRIQEKSEFSIESLANDRRIMKLNQGQIISKVQKLNKEDSFQIKTPTTIASVRGTEFNVIYGQGKTLVSVGSGKVAVAAENTDLAKAQVADTGSTAESKESVKDKSISIEIRKATKNETLAVQKVSAVPIVADPDKKSADELNILFKPVIENDRKIDQQMTPEKAEKQKAIIQKGSGTLAEIKEAFNRVDEITLYNKKVITGYVLSRGDTWVIVTPDGKVNVAEKDVKNIRIIR
jgi:hypothetical protein